MSFHNCLSSKLSVKSMAEGLAMFKQMKNSPEFGGVKGVYESWS